MDFVSGLLVLVVSWWICFFIVLPIGVKSQHESGHVEPGTDPGAPADPQIARKALWATAGAVVITIILAIVLWIRG